MKKLALLLFCSLGVVSSAASGESSDFGRQLYFGRGACSTCHGALGDGDGIASKALDPPPRSFTKGNYYYDADGDGLAGTADDIVLIINNGALNYGGSSLMLARPDLTPDEARALANYLLSLKR